MKLFLLLSELKIKSMNTTSKIQSDRLKKKKKHFWFPAGKISRLFKIPSSGSQRLSWLLTFSRYRLLNGYHFLCAKTFIEPHTKLFTLRFGFSAGFVFVGFRWRHKRRREWHERRPSVTSHDGGVSARREGPK